MARFLVLLACMSGVVIAMENPKPSAETRAGGTVVILGASYAGSWPIEMIDGRRVINRGVGGDESHMMLERFDRDVAALQPDIVVIWGFINDIFRSTPDEVVARTEDSKRDLEEIVDRVVAIGATPLLATEVTLPRFTTWDQRIIDFVYPLIGRTTYPVYVNGHVDRLNDWLREFSSSRGIRLLDFAAVLTDETGARASTYAQPDGSHLNDAAYQRLTAYVTSTDLVR